uniref:Uncharacterized protein MANES_02G129800 n=1 Tax=Rhizophora mucronata TaxID=61149 RepID=A0A2P2NKB5_RHIMU
MGWVLRGN